MTFAKAGRPAFLFVVGADLDSYSDEAYLVLLDFFLRNPQLVGNNNFCQAGRIGLPIFLSFVQAAPPPNCRLWSMMGISFSFWPTRNALRRPERSPPQSVATTCSEHCGITFLTITSGAWPPSPPLSLTPAAHGLGVLQVVLAGLGVSWGLSFWDDLAYPRYDSPALRLRQWTMLLTLFGIFSHLLSIESTTATPPPTPPPTPPGGIPVPFLVLSLIVATHYRVAKPLYVVPAPSLSTAGPPAADVIVVPDHWLLFCGVAGDCGSFGGECDGSPRCQRKASLHLLPAFPFCPLLNGAGYRPQRVCVRACVCVQERRG